MPKTKKEKNWKKDILILLSHVHIELYWLKIVISKSFSCYLPIIEESIDILTLIIIHYWDFEWGSLLSFVSLCWESRVDWWAFIMIISFSRGVLFRCIFFSLVNTLCFFLLWSFWFFSIIYESLSIHYSSLINHLHICVNCFDYDKNWWYSCFYYLWRMKSSHLCSESQFDYLFFIRLIYQYHSLFALLLFVFQIWMCLELIHHQ